MVPVRQFSSEEWDVGIATGGQSIGPSITAALARFYGADEYAGVGFGWIAAYKDGELLGFFDSNDNPEFRMNPDDYSVVMYARELVPALRM